MKTTTSTKKYPGLSYVEYHGLSDALRKKLSEELHIHQADVEDIFSPTQLSKFEIRKKYVYFALQLADSAIVDRIATKQIHCIVSPQQLLVIDENNLNTLAEFSHVRNKLVTHQHYTSFDLFYELLDISITSMFAILQSLQNRVKTIEGRLFSESHIENDHISQIQQTKKNIINFKSLLGPLSDMLEELITKHTDLIDETGKEAIDDSLDKLKKLENRLDNFRDVMKLLTETNEMLIARSTNQTVRRLTLFNVLLLVPSLTAAFFGMNVHFGWFSALSDNILPLVTIIILMIILTAGIYAFFLWKKWI